ncbi:ABC transporter substrate-binding protein [Promicromonospora sp. NPDC050880]|uniref:ABC transporter substrate-binding protein n=1 Tax=Promicromonospora sp. NPDC050880 TaxID=3364406 RepID=UPI0037973E7A
MIRRSTAARGLAVAAVLSVGLAACATTSDGGEGEGSGSSDPLKIGTLLPLTGNLAYLGPPEVAGVGLAVADINEAGGVLGNDVEIASADSGDGDNLAVSTNSVTDLLGQDVSAIIGAASSTVTLNVVDSVTEAGVLQVSPANTSTTLSGYSPLFARTAPPDTVQGQALGSLMLEDGHQKVAFLTMQDDYATGLRDNVQKAVEAGGGEVVYGGTGDGTEFAQAETNFANVVSDALAAKPDAIAIFAFEETKAAIAELVTQKWEFAGNTYLCDGNTADYSKDFDPGTLEGVKGTIPGADAPEDFKERLNEWYQEDAGEELSDYAYAPESYDAAILVALAAVRGEGTDGQTLADNIRAVSGSEEGATEVSTFEEGVEALEAGDEISYTGVAGIGPLNEDNDPSSAFIGVYEYDDTNKNIWTKVVEGSVQG